MLSVVIYPRSAQKSLDEYRLLFENTVEDGRIKFCFWDENGTDFSTSLPELPALLQGVNEWRAIIALPLSKENESDLEKSAADNPFDWLENDDLYPLVSESSIPLIRLCQILGGVPDLNRTATRHKASKDGVFDQERYQQLMDLQKAEFDRLNELYQSPVPNPEELWILKGRPDHEYRSVSYEEAQERNQGEIRSSLFWQRNRYPACCRFMVQDMARPISALYDESMFGFWLTVLVLAVNRFPPGSFEAYRLYDVHAEMNLEKLQAYFSDYFNRLSSIRFFVSQTLLELREIGRDSDETQIPNLEEMMPIRLTAKREDGIFIPLDRTSLTGDIPEIEILWWREEVRKSRRAFRKTLSRYEKNIERNSSSARIATQIDRSEYGNFNQYQIQSIRDEVAEYENDVLTGFTPVILSIRKVFRNLKNRDREIEETMARRPYTKKALAATAVCVICTVTGFIPLITWGLTQNQSLGPFNLSANLSFWGSLGLCILMLLIFWGQLISKIFHYNKSMLNALEAVEKKFPVIGKYLKNCCAALRGNAVIDIFEKENHQRSSDEIACLEHIRAIDNRMNIVQGWLRGLNIRIIPDDAVVKSVIFDADIPPERNKAYLLDEKDPDSGITLADGTEAESPFSFVEKLEAERIPVYEKNGPMPWEESEEK